MSHETDPKQDRIETSTRQVFDASVEQLDGATRSRLAQARALAVEAAEGRRSTMPAFGRLQIAGIGIAAALAVAIVWLPQQAPESSSGELAALEDIDILLDEGEIELFEDLEFFAWLEAQGETGLAGESDGNG